jgi:demethylmenaquinone methyltransferase/2-methoxy-6-polyprenyl-1,4-benzoquinol methylase
MVRDMFARIVPTYDLMNALMTFGLHNRWRALAASEAAPDGAERVLDLASGTGDLAMALVKEGARQVVAVDSCPEMLFEAARKLGDNHSKDVLLVGGDGLRLPFGDAEFDAVTIGFGLRNFADIPTGLAEIRRVLRPGGRLVCLEMTRLPLLPIGWLYLTFFHIIVPAIGGLVSGDFAAYRYLPISVGKFPDARGLAKLLKSSGFDSIRFRFVGLGAVAIHVAAKPDLQLFRQPPGRGPGRETGAKRPRR